ncbi:leucine-rich repeat (LRR) family protein [Striga asiatica]|uniref:Leucine-rich repeat (LRR) family protein n=1 Tax=Striga asiatica TaxID=4170 RepID=A0A5A7RIJ7_STRAF|nr:leucine-rich repeat (LRR) family protein [Striga asiatica]
MLTLQPWLSVSAASVPRSRQSPPLGAFVVQILGNLLLDMVRHLVARLPGHARLLRWQLLQERHLILRHRVHEEEERIEPLVPSCRGPVEKARPHPYGHGHDLVRELRKERREPEEIRLAARGPLRAHHKVPPFSEDGLDETGVEGPVPRETGRLDGGEELGEARNRGGRHVDGVQDRAVGAHEHYPLFPTAGGPEFWRSAFDGRGGAEESRDGFEPGEGAEGADEDAGDGKEKADREPEDDEEREEWGRFLDETAVVEDHGLREGFGLNGLYPWPWWDYLHEREICFPVSDPHVRDMLTAPEHPPHGQSLVLPDEHSGPRHKPRSITPPRGHFRAQHHINPEIVLEEGLHHYPWIGRDNTLLPAR